MKSEDFVDVGGEHVFKVVPGPGVSSLFFHKTVGGIPRRQLVLIDLPAVPTAPQCRAILEHLLKAPDYLRTTEDDILEVIRACKATESARQGRDPSPFAQA